MIRDGDVFLSDVPVKKPSDECDDPALLSVRGYVREYVSRGGYKLAALLDAFGIDVSGAVALDVGASTGGFTDCLLKRGAEKVFALDSGHGQLAPELSSDRRVVSMEGRNARDILPSDIGEPVSLIVMDVSFISQTCIIPSLPPLCADGAVFAALIKPQFEAGRDYVGRGGIVRSADGHRNAIIRTVTCAAENGFTPVGIIDSPIEGGDGNREYLAAYRYTGRKNGSDAASAAPLSGVIKEFLGGVRL